MGQVVIFEAWFPKMSTDTSIIQIQNIRVKERPVEKLISIHELEVPEDRQAEMEQFFRDEIASFHLFEGWHFSLLKADRGKRVGQYAVMVEIDSVAARDRYYPQEGVASEEASQVREDNPEFFKKWSELIAKFHRDWTGYQLLFEAEKTAA
jgi:hypothetical protein